MSGRQTIDYDPVEALLDQGRRDLAAGQPEKARWCFEEVLRRRPTDARALLGMSYVERHSERPVGDGASILTADLQVVQLVKDKRYEEALDLLRREALVRPDDDALQKSIKHLQAHIARLSTPPAAPEESTKESAAAEASAPRADEAAEKKAAKEAPLDVAEARGAKDGPSAEQRESGERLSPAARQAEGGIDAPVVSAAKAADSQPSRTGGGRFTPPPSEETSEKPALQPSSGKHRKLRPKANRDIDEDSLKVPLLVPEDLSSSGGVRLADELPSGPALGSLPPAPLKEEGTGSGMWWLLLAVVVVVAAALWTLRQ